MIKFINQPKLSGHEVDKALDEARVYLVPKIEEFVSSHSMFKGDDINISFFHTGVSSLVCLIDSESNKYILKMKLRPSKVNMEASFLKKWEDINIKVPRIYEVGYIEDYNYILMEYISSDILTKVYTTEELISKNIFFEMGQILRKMHTLKSNGFGAWNENEKSKYKTFKEWLDSDTGIQNQIRYTKENNLLPEEIFGSFKEKINLIIDFINKDKISTYCHFDFSPNNMLATEPITIFDPVCLVNHPYIDLAKSVIQSIANCRDSRCSKQIIDGYFKSNKELLDREVFKACLLFITYIKFPYWHKKGYKDIIEMEKDFLLKEMI